MASSSRGVAPPSISSARASTPSMRCWYSGTREARKPGGFERAASALVGVIVILIVGLCFVDEGLDRFLAIARQQHFHFLLRCAQRGLTLTRERNAALESLERLLERHITLFEFRNQRFEFGQRLFEVGEFRF